jgi:hypothetical protein
MRTNIIDDELMAQAMAAAVNCPPFRPDSLA